MTNARFKTENLIKTKIICFPKMQPNTDFSGGDKLYINHLSDTNIKLGWNVWYAGEDNDIKILNNFFDLKNVKYKIKDQEIIRSICRRAHYLKSKLTDFNDIYYYETNNFYKFPDSELAVSLMTIHQTMILAIHCYLYMNTMPMKCSSSKAKKRTTKQPSSNEYIIAVICNCNI